MYPPRALGFAFGTIEGADAERRCLELPCPRDARLAADFLEAEAEAMRMWRGLRFLE